MAVYQDEWGFQVNANGELLDTDYNYQLEMRYREEEEARNMPAVQTVYTRDRGNEYATGSRLSRDRINTQHGGGNRHPALNNRGYDDEPIRRGPVLSNSYPTKKNNPSRRDLDIDVDDEPAVKPRQQEKVKSLNEPVRNMAVMIKPVDNVYHDTLLPAGFKQTKIYLPDSELDENTMVRYYKREITNETTEYDMDNRFGENYFGSNTGFIPVAIEQAEIVDTTKKNGSDYPVVLQNDDMVDQILYLVPEDRIDNNKIYMADSYLATRYYNNTGKNLFMELANAAVTSPVDLMDKLESYYNRYMSNEYTRNGILKIDAVLTNSLNTYLAAYAGKPGYFVRGFMLGVKPMYNKIRDEIKDGELKKNLLAAITTCLTNLMINIKEYADTITEENSTVDLFCPTRELVVISKNKNIARELSEISKEQPNEFLFKLIDRNYTPYIHDMVARIDKDKIIQKHNRLVFFTFENMYSILKGMNGCYYISSYNRLVK